MRSFLLKLGRFEAEGPTAFSPEVTNAARVCVIRSLSGNAGRDILPLVRNQR